MATLHKNSSLKLWIISVLITYVQTNNCDNDVHVYKFVEKNIGLIDSYIWNGTAQKIRNCVRMCVARKPCQSINYDFATKVCELNSGTLENRATKSGKTLVYSSFAWWPESIDDACFSRPCADDQVCISGQRVSKAECSYFCMPAGRKVCPWLDTGLWGRRYVGDTNVLSCGPGLTGSITATCLETGQWDKVVACTEILNHPCTDDTLCSDMNAVCDNGRCTCGANTVYNSSTNLCSPDCGNPPSAVHAHIISNDKTMVTYECDEHYYPKVASAPSTRVCTRTNGWSPAHDFECYGLRLYPSIIKPEFSICLFLHGIANSPNAGIQPEIGRLKIGYLEIFMEGEWGNVQYEESDNWNWQATNVACRQLGYRFGGSFEYGSYNPAVQRYPMSLKSFRLDNLKCDQNADGLESCSYNISSSYGPPNMDITLMCFDFAFRADTCDRTYGSLVKGFLWVQVGNSRRPVCKSNWGENETSVACKTINRTYIRIDEGSRIIPNTGKPAVSFFCDGSEPHLFFCRSSGLIYDNRCPGDRHVHITCESDQAG